MPLEEIIYPKPDPPDTGPDCPKCGYPTHHGSIPCPDQKPGSTLGCLVLHYGYTCSGCGSIFNWVPASRLPAEKELPPSVRAKGK